MEYISCVQMAMKVATALRQQTTYLMLILMAMLLMLLGSNGQIVQSNTPGQFTGTIFSLDLPGNGAADQPQPVYCFRTWDWDGDTPLLYRLVFCGNISTDDIPIDVVFIVSYDNITDGVMYSCTMPEIRQDVTTGTMLSRIPRAPRILVYITTFCGYVGGPAATPEEVTDLLVGADSHNRSLAEYIRTCSFGRVSLLPGNVKVLGPVEVPCQGNLKPPLLFAAGSNFSSRACKDLDIIKWHHWLDAWAAETHYVTADDYHHRVILLPRGFSRKTPGCGGFAGLGTPGRYKHTFTANNQWGSGLIWWSGDYPGDLEVLLHEMGHTYGMAHASVPGGCELRDQCDNTCTMGAKGGQGIRCLNAPHNWQIGWGRPLLKLGDSELPVGIAAVVHIPSQLNTKYSSVMVKGSGMTANKRIFISARLNVYPYDLPWESGQDNEPFLLIHTYDGTKLAPYKPTVLVAQILPGHTWRDRASRLVVQFDSWNSGRAAIRICRRASETETGNCSNGLDDDCDFFLDDDDPDCKKKNRGVMRDPPLLRPFPKQPFPRPLQPPPTPNLPPPPRLAPKPSPVAHRQP